MLAGKMQILSSAREDGVVGADGVEPTNKTRLSASAEHAQELLVKEDPKICQVIMWFPKPTR